MAARFRSTATLGLFAYLLAVGCGSPSRPVLLFDTRVQTAALRQRFAADHGSMDQVKLPRRSSDFLQFVSGKRYAFVVRRNGVLAVAPLPTDASHNPYAHEILALGEAVVTAGGITVVHTRDTVSKIVIDADSATYCPTPDSVREAVPILAQAGIPSDRIRVDNRPRTCAADQPAAASSTAGPLPTRDYGDVMVEMDRRFRLVGEAVGEKRGDLADYELFGLLRSVRDDLPQAGPPETARRERLQPFARTFIDSDFPFLRQAIWDEDWARAREGVARVTATCNGCHAAGNVGFVKVGALHP
ncbi:MAG TPA: hypothetical protein VHU82_14095 [Vicinamibacterales bacterium]|jgi:hypothetical protein|nr:hypothetical protein [Vicinamibacterales bacterium]